MAVLTAQGISQVAIELLVRTLVLPRTVTAIPGREFAGSNGDTITVRVPQPGAARTQATPGSSITYDDVDEVAVDVSLSHLYHGKRLSDEELSLDLENFSRQVGRVQTSAVAIGAEDELATAMNGLTADEADLTASNVETKILNAREHLGESNAPAGDRFCAVSPAAATLLLQVDKFVRVDQSGDDSALRRAEIGTLYGFRFIESNGLTGGDNDQAMVFYHRSGFTFANRVPQELALPGGQGASMESAVASTQGIGLRHVLQYQADILSWASVVSTFAGAAAVWEDGATATDNQRFYKVEDATV